jgi:thiol-disulfide isomerase/thioredoxin
MKILFRAVLVSVFAFMLLSSSATYAAVAMPEFSLTSVTNGQTVTSKSFSDKVLLVTFFATWCPPCRQEIPTLKTLHEELGPRGFSVIGLSVDEGGRKIVDKLVQLEKINYPVLMANRATADNFGGISGVPTSFLINRQGNVVKTYQGYVPHKVLERDIRTVLK